MKILAGEFKNRQIQAPKGEATRPTSGKIRGGVFDRLQHQIGEARFLDLFAGSGSMGIEALSRGAVHATFVEKDPLAAKALRHNLDALGLHPRATFLQIDVRRAITKLAKETPFDIIYVDPPYALEIAPFLTHIGPLLAQEGVLIVEQRKKHLLTLPGLALIDDRSFGDTILFFFGHANG